MRRDYFLVGVMLAAEALVATLVAYPYLPDRVPTHWNVRGEADAFGPRWTLFIWALG